ncbi:MAG: hypothetical protein ACK471_13905, partial [Dolichospermum sp.]
VIWNRIKSRGQLVCGISGELPGFSFVGEYFPTAGIYSGNNNLSNLKLYIWAHDFPPITSSYLKLERLSSPQAEITKTSESIDKIINNHDNEPQYIEKVIFCLNPIQITKI